MSNAPPKNTLNFLRWFCREDYLEEIEGDLVELFAEQYESHPYQATLRFHWNVLLHFRPSFFKPFATFQSIASKSMFRNYIIIALRNLKKRFTYSFINIAGLAFGMAICLLILQYVSFELSYDKFFHNGENIYRIQLDRYDKGVLSTRWASGCAVVGKFAKENFPEVEKYVRLRSASGVMRYINAQNIPTRFKEERIYAATPSFLDVFSVNLMQGNALTALDDAYEIIISQKTAEKYFGEDEPLGKTLTLNENADYTVTGVFEDFPNNSHFRGEFIFSYATILKWYGDDAENAWDWDGFYNYVQLAPGTDPAVFSEKLTEAANETNKERWGSYNHSAIFTLQPLDEIHLYSNYIGEFEVMGNGDTVYFLLIISFFVIAIAWINYINLSTARSLDRAREVGVRKVMGSHKRHLISQFLIETSIINLFAIFLACAIVVFTLPFFSDLIGRTITFSLFLEKEFWLLVVAMFVVGTLMAGLYPSFVLSSFRPVAVLKGKMSHTKHGTLLRKGLVIFQFAASIVLIACTAMVYKQVNFMQSQELGVDIEQTLVIEIPQQYGDSTYNVRSQYFKNELLTQSVISGISFSSDIPGRSPEWNAGGIRLVSQDETEAKQYRVLAVDYDFMDVYALDMARGRKFSEQFPNDPSAVILNEEGIKALGFEQYEEALQKDLFFWGDTFQIIGVMKNYHQSSLKEAHEPLIFRMAEKRSENYASVKIKTEDLHHTINAVEAKWREVFPEKPFNYFFLDDYFDKNYQSDTLFGKVFFLFATLALLIACSGLFGLASYNTLQRTKEIGIRKTFGASVSSILVLIAKDFIWLVCISFIIGIPIAYFIMDAWLQEFAYRTVISWWIFLISGFLMLVIALGSVFFQSVQAAMLNPINSLRAE